MEKDKAEEYGKRNSEEILSIGKNNAKRKNIQPINVPP